MTQTAQPCSWVLLNNADRDLTADKEPGEEDNIGLLISVLDSLNRLSEKLDRLDHLTQRKEIGQTTGGSK
jgi:hypothetical protein